MNETLKPGDKQSPNKAPQLPDNTAAPGGAKKAAGGTTQEAPISLPTGGGAIRSMGEKFQANPVTGTASLSVPVKVSPGRSGFTPQLILGYDSGNGNGIFGLGWNIGLPSITRRTSKGLPQYNDLAETDTFLLSGSEDLVPFLEEHNGQWQPVKLQKNGEDTIGNRTEATNDYRVLQAWQLKDANHNRRQVAFDVRGMVTAVAAMGKEGETDVDKMGDTLADPTSRIEYELFNWINHRRPNGVHTYAREKHGAANTRFQESYLYTGGLGQEILTKTQAEPGLAFTRDAAGALILDSNGQPLLAQTTSRWVGTGRTVRNNKGEPVRQYEPYFSSTPVYEDEEELRQFGVTVELFYDPVGRVIKTLHPDGTLEKVIFAVWQQQHHDRNDTVLESNWYSDRNSPDPTGPEPTDAEQRAAWLSAQHANTPQEDKEVSTISLWSNQKNISLGNKKNSLRTFHQIKQFYQGQNFL